MKVIEILKNLARAFEDVENPDRSELRQLRDRVRIFETENVLRSVDGKRSAK